MKPFAHVTLVACIAMLGSGAALADDDCGMNTNKPCPPPEKLIIKEPANTSSDTEQRVVRRTNDGVVRAEVQSKDGDETAARATLTGITAEDLKIKPKKPCNLNSNTPCEEEGGATDPD